MSLNLNKDLVYPNIIIVGPSGSGKSTSLENLDGETTAIINIERKQLPFRNFKKFKHHYMVSSAAEVSAKMMEANLNPNIEVIVEESFTSYAEAIIKQVRANATGDGFKTWDNHNKLIREHIEYTKSIKGKFVVFLAIDELLNEGSGDGLTTKSVRRCWVKGRELEGKIEKEFVIALWTFAEKQTDGKIKYYFLTNTDGVCAAKTPRDLFPQLKIDNDLQKVLVEVRKYYDI